MTGLDLAVDELVEVAVVVTDFDLVPADDGFSVVIKPSRKAFENMGEFVTAMHRDSGLLVELPHGTSLADAERQALEYIQGHVPIAQQAPLAGNSIGTDRAFLTKHMPKVDAHLHYRNIDVSSVKELARRWFPRIYFNSPVKHGGHRALADILESIRELDFYRRIAFVAEPGPSTEAIQAAAAEVVERWSPRLAPPTAVQAREL